MDQSLRYSVISEFLARKARARRVRARVKYSEKIVILERLRKEVRAVLLAREKRRRPPQA